MTALLKRADPWMQTVHQLKALPSESVEGSAPKAGRAENDFILQLTRAWDRDHPQPSNDRRPFPQAVVRVIERPSSATALVYWSDPGTCHYGYQGWRATTATGEGVCSLSGTPIHRGDPIYRPSQRDPKPQNASAMILAAAMPVDEEVEADVHE
ncbi:hypothetical protein AWB81_04856 [Caballeronia arationis]|nr:DUF3331 domain-containing protein [Caballeronia arationis]SAK90929.1 hypothetical protein AWB81_04856 [Caballeronia arationis]